MTLTLANHLWQSTLVAAVAGLLTLALRRNRAQVRYWLWLTASVKFLIPFAALVSLGGQFGWVSSVPIAQAELPFAMDAVSQPFSRPELRPFVFVATGSAGMAGVLPNLLVAIWLCGCVVILLTWWVRWRRVAVAVHGASPLQEGRELVILRHLEKLAGINKHVVLVASDSSFEPGVFGILKPVLLWPRGISNRLNDAQIEAILAHELSHVRRFDNLAAAVQMLVSATFWFHPLVWWIGARLVHERENACDQDVIRLGSQPQVYAESILKTCQHFVESPLVCVAGVTGSDLKKRIEQIMRNATSEELSPWRKLVLATAGFATVAGPVGVGLLTERPLRAQVAQSSTSAQAPVFEVASIKPSKPGEGLMRMQIQPGGRMNVTNVPLRTMIRNAYRVQDFQIVGGADWVTADRFDITAKAEGNPTGEQMTLMLRALLAERFKLTLHNETRELPIYALIMARSDGRLAPQLRKAVFDCAPLRNGPPPPPPPPGSAGDAFNCGFRVGLGTMTGRGSSMPALAGSLSTWVNRIVLDRTGLSGDFDLDLKWTPDQLPQGPPPPGAPPLPSIDPNGPSIFTALQEQLGLKLESQRGPVDVLVIDSAEQPTPD